MKILSIIPPYVPSYFNAGHHLPVFQVATYLKHHYANFIIDAIDAAALNFHWKNICDLLVKCYDVILIYCDFDGIDTLDRFIYYVRSFHADSKIVVFGRLCKQSPNYFLKYDVDAIQHKGDYEPAIRGYIEYISGNNPKPCGIILSDGYRSDAVEIFNPEEWIMPNVSLIPYTSYNNMYKNDLDKFCGIPQRQELVVPIARGCPINCSFCDVPFMQGLKERRYDANKTFEYIKNSFDTLPFEYVTFYAPTFTLNHPWVNELCLLLINSKKKYSWKCTTALPTLNEDLIELMAKAGCVRISLGIESFSLGVSISLPKCKRESYSKFQSIVNICKKNNIELNCFIILGLEGDTPQDAEYTINEVLKSGARVRPTIYTPYNLFTEDLDIASSYKFNRQIIYKRDDLSKESINKYYELFYNNKLDKSTKIMEVI